MYCVLFGKLKKKYEWHIFPSHFSMLTSYMFINCIKHLQMRSFSSQPMDTEPLRQSDLIIVSSMTKTPGYNPDQMIGEFCMNTGLTKSLFNALEHA